VFPVEFFERQATSCSQLDCLPRVRHINANFLIPSAACILHRTCKVVDTKLTAFEVKGVTFECGVHFLSTTGLEVTSVVGILRGELPDVMHSARPLQRNLGSQRTHNQRDFSRMCSSRCCFPICFGYNVSPIQAHRCLWTRFHLDLLSWTGQVPFRGCGRNLEGAGFVSAIARGVRPSASTIHGR